jgi:hypothetical protein
VKVKELIEILQKLDQEKEICIDSDGLTCSIVENYIIEEDDKYTIET